MAMQITIRAIFAYIFLFVLTRIMGKREISQLTFFDYIVGISIGTITGSIIFETSSELTELLPALIVFSASQIIISYLSLKSVTLRKIFAGSKTLLIEKGKIIEENMSKSRLNIDELSSKLRENNVFRLSDVEYAFLETSGKVSVMKKSNKQPVTLEDMNIVTTNKGIGKMLIEEGKIDNVVLRENKLTKAWLIAQLSKQGINDIEDVMFCQVDEAMNLYIDKYDKSVNQ